MRLDIAASRGWAYALCVRVQQAGRGFREFDEGSALIEFAASAVLFFTLLFGIVDFSRALYVDHFVATAAQEATRYAMVRGASWTSTCAAVPGYGCTATSSNIGTFVQSLAPAGVVKSSLSVTVSWPGTDATGASCTSSGSSAANSAGCTVSVVVSYPFAFATPLIVRKTLSLSSTSQVTIVQ